MIIKEDDEHHGGTNLGAEPWLRVQGQPLDLWRVALLRSAPSSAAPGPVSWFQCGGPLEVSLSEAAIVLGWMTEVTVQHQQC